MTKKYSADNTFFISDLHFGHRNLLVKKFTKRHEIYGEDVNFMNEDLIKRWNAKVPVDAHVFMLGDFGFMQYTKLFGLVERLNGTIHCIRGNHDDQLNFPNVDGIYSYHEIEIDGNSICMSHYPFYTWNGCHRGSWMLCGHEHGNINNDPHMQTWKIMDVGVDCHSNYEPFSYHEIKAIMDNRQVRGHHGRNNVG